MNRQPRESSEDYIARMEKELRETKVAKRREKGIPRELDRFADGWREVLTNLGIKRRIYAEFADVREALTTKTEFQRYIDSLLYWKGDASPELLDTARRVMIKRNKTALEIIIRDDYVGLSTVVAASRGDSKGTTDRIAESVRAVSRELDELPENWAGEDDGKQG